MHQNKHLCFNRCVKQRTFQNISINFYKFIEIYRNILKCSKETYTIIKMPVCQFCNKDMSTMSSLNNHQKRTKKCLILQGIVPKGSLIVSYVHQVI